MSQSKENEKHRCHDADDPDAHDCVKEADPRFTMDFSDIGEEPLYWCSVCGPLAHDMSNMLMKSIEKVGINPMEAVVDFYSTLDSKKESLN